MAFWNLILLFVISLVSTEDSAAACWPRRVEYQETHAGFLQALLTPSLQKYLFHEVHLKKKKFLPPLGHWFGSGFQCNHTLCCSFEETAIVQCRGANTEQLPSSNNNLTYCTYMHPVCNTRLTKTLFFCVQLFKHNALFIKSDDFLPALRNWFHLVT